MIAHAPFDTNVPVIGNVSAGKLTLLSALLQAKYSEVLMKRTTAGINYFRLHVKNGQAGSAVGTVKDCGKVTTWTNRVDYPSTTPATLKEITAANVVLRNEKMIQEKHFDVMVEEMPCEMHPDTCLVLVDVPGLNEAHMGTKYKEYLASKLHTFDCVIVVMDGKQGVNTDDQINLLKLVKERQSVRW
jgi:hypothetical protein